MISEERGNNYGGKSKNQYVMPIIWKTSNKKTI